tara:strand:- start:201 stop:431 length:231 start_codon:yes stop_codon:yes gene_type:complete
VIIGISLSLYELNKIRIKNLMNFIVESKVISKNKKQSNTNKSSDKELDIDRNKLKLVEKIEELGFIPSKENDSNAA